MREITKILTLSLDGKSFDFRLTKLDAFSGVTLLRMLSKLPEDLQSTILAALSAFSDSDLRDLMTVCLEHCEVRLPAGWNPVMTRGEWSYVELEHDIAACLKLTVEEVLWTLEGFFGGSGLRPPPVEEEGL